MRASRGKARAAGSPHIVVYRAHGREGTQREAKGHKAHEGQATRNGSEEGTGAKEEHAAQHVVYHARHAFDLSRRVVGVACRRVRGGQALQALVCPSHVPVNTIL